VLTMALERAAVVAILSVSLSLSLSESGRLD
jgi:hypothetical protein